MFTFLKFICILFSRDVYDILRKYFGQKNDTALIIQGIELLRFDGETGANTQELDFLIINYTHQYIMNIEVKKRLVGYILLKAKKQLETIQSILENWFSADLNGKWRYVSALYCQDLDESIIDCGDCKQFIAQGKEDLINKISAIEIKLIHGFMTSSRYPKDLLFLSKYLLYCSPCIGLPVRGNIYSAIRKAIQDEAGMCTNYDI